MTLELVEFASTDGIELPALLYKPKTPTKRVAIWLHGMGDSGVFYNSERTNALGTALTDVNIAFFSFNNRGAHHKKSLHKVVKGRREMTVMGGSHYELISECTYDIDGAVGYLTGLGYREFYLVGHSTGANKICLYNYAKQRAKAKNPFSKYVLAGPGDDTGLYFAELGADTFAKDLDTAQRQIKSGDGAELMPSSSDMADFAAQSAYDILNPNGAYNTFPFYEATTKRIGTKKLFQELRSIRIPLLVIIGEQDEYMHTAGTASDALILLEENIHESIIDDCGFVNVAAADHSFSQHSEFFAKTVAGWLAEKGGA